MGWGDVSLELHPGGAAESGAVSARRELKFALPDTDLGRLRSVLRTNVRHVAHHRSTSLVRSLYFDDEELGGYTDGVEGASDRRKVRLRWYDDGDQDRRFFFEVKRRRFELVLKERVPVETAEIDGPITALRHRDLIRHLSATLPGAFRERLRIQSTPVLLGEYRREYFEAIDRSLRLTLDSQMQWFSQLGRRMLSRRFGVSLPRLVILEIKTKPEVEVDVDALVHPLKLAPTRSSKYVVGCQQLGLAADTRGSLV